MVWGPGFDSGCAGDKLCGPGTVPLFPWLSVSLGLGRYPPELPDMRLAICVVISGHTEQQSLC